MKCPICEKEEDHIFNHLYLWHPVDDDIGAHEGTITSVRMIEVILEILGKKEFWNELIRELNDSKV